MTHRVMVTITGPYEAKTFLADWLIKQLVNGFDQGAMVSPQELDRKYTEDWFPSTILAVSVDKGKL